MQSMITHKGLISKIRGRRVTVVISPQADECTGCAISRMCAKSEKLEVECADASALREGQEVTIGTTVGTQRRATMLFFVIPVTMVLVIAVTLSACGASEWVTAISALGALVLWYGIMYLARVRFGSKAQFTIIE